jgi:RNA polymerase sigma-70 factor (sigma-E family)
VDAGSGERVAELAKRPPRAAERTEQLVQAHSTDAVRFAYLLTGDRELAADIAQDSFVRLFARFRDRGGPDAIRSYLRTTIVNLCRDHWRRRRTAADYLLRAQREEEVETLPPFEVRDELWHALQQLPRRQRAALVLRYFEDLSERETADILGCPVGAVKALVTRGNHAMRTMLGDIHG